ncbi:MAG TPA: hypothetical protein VLH15_08105 [Dehalococcoidales bacterium]|nr:hypothetical protein [Dehalococcoidales bacterium]
MARKFKLDLHTHPVEALKAEMGIKGIREINVPAAEAIVKAIKAAGLNGIAITEKENFNHGWVAGLQILDHFQKENLVILPGLETEYNGQHFLQIYIPDYYRRRMPFFKGQAWFNVLAHPGFYHPLDSISIEGLKLDAVESHSLLGDFEASEVMSREMQIPPIRTSDAHTLGQIGHAYIEVEFLG